MKKINEIMNQIHNLSTEDIIKAAYDAYAPRCADGWAIWDVERQKLRSITLQPNVTLYVPGWIKLYDVSAYTDYLDGDILDERELAEYKAGEEAEKYDCYDYKAYFMAAQGMSKKEAAEELERRELDVLRWYYIKEYEEYYPNWDNIQEQVEKYLER